MIEKYMTVDEVATKYGKAAITVYRAIADGDLPHVRFGRTLAIYGPDAEARWGNGQRPVGRPRKPAASAAREE